MIIELCVGVGALSFHLLKWAEESKKKIFSRHFLSHYKIPKS